MLRNQTGHFMRGGKREGAGRKGLKTKVMRIPIDLESQVLKLIEEHKERLLIPVTESKECAKPEFPALSKEQLKSLREWLIKERFAKSATDARNQTKTPIQCRKTYSKYIHLSGDKSLNAIAEIMEMYAYD